MLKKITKIFNQKQSIFFHVITAIMGIILCIIGGKLYLSNYEKLATELTIDIIVYLTMYVLIIFLGIVCLLVNFVDEWIKKLLLILLGAGIMGIFVIPPIRVGIILFIVACVIYLLCMKFKNVFSTTVTFFLLAVIYIILTSIIMKYIPSEYGYLTIYSMLSGMLILYRVLGVEINKWFIGIMGFKEESDAYDAEQLKNQIFLLYFIIFVILNVLLYLGKTNNDIWNLVNNSFLTGIAIIQIDLNKIVNKDKKGVDE